MPRLSEKTQLLDNAGYAYNFDRMMYINREARKAFSYEYIEDHPANEIADNIREQNDDHADEWKFYTNFDLPESTKIELKKVLQ